jgi:hypothetical protein
MAIAIGFGVLFATFITLLMVPCLYLILDDFNRIARKILKSLGLAFGEEKPVKILEEGTR